MPRPYAAALFLLVAFSLGIAHAEDPLTLSVPHDIEVEATGFFTPVKVGAAVADSATGDPYNIQNNSPGIFLVGTTIVTWFAHDTGGNHAIAEQIILVRDTAPPVFGEFPKYVKFESKSGDPISIDFDLPVAVDIADPTVTVTSSHAPGSEFPVGNTTVTFTATDDSGNQKTMDVIVMVEGRARVQNLVLEPASDSISVSWDSLGSDTQYRAVLTNTATGDRADSTKTHKTHHTFERLEPGTIYKVVVYDTDDRSTRAVGYAATIQSGGAGQTDTTAPVITVPLNVVLEATASLTPVQLGNATASDDTDPSPVITNNSPAGFPVGTTTVTWKAVDSSGNVAIGGQAVTVTDTTAPVFAAQPTSVTRTAASIDGLAVEFDIPTATDIADPDVTVTSSHAPGSIFPIGDTAVTFTATDDSGNMATQEITVTVKDWKIRNIKTSGTTSSITATWNTLEGNVEYRVTLINSTGSKVYDLTTTSDTHTFEGLNPSANYAVQVHDRNDESTKATADTYTEPLLLLHDDFSTVDGWVVSAYVGDVSSESNDRFATYHAGGKPSPSGKLSGLGNVSSYTLSKEYYIDDLSRDIYFGIDYRAEGSGPYIVGLSLTEIVADYHGILSGGPTDYNVTSDWKSYNVKNTHLVSNAIGIKMNISISTYAAGGISDFSFYLDNVSVSSSPLPVGYVWN